LDGNFRVPALKATPFSIWHQKELHMSNTRQKLTEVAFELFGRNGFHAIGLDAIIAAAGVSKQTFYNHFECKDDLVLAVLAHRHEAEGALMARLFSEIAGPKPKDRLYKLFDVLQAWFDQPEWRGCIFMTAAAEFPLQTEPAHQAAKAHFQSTLEWFEGMAASAGAEDPKLLAEQLVVLVHGLVSVRHVTGSDHFMPIARAAARGLLDRQFAPPTPKVKPAPEPREHTGRRPLAV
jgi:AcrR family transcriptional regulator